MERLTDITLLERWVPARVYWNANTPIVDWCYLGRRRFEHPFFEQTISDALNEPFNLLFRHQTPIEVLGQWSEARPGLRPTGFIFHMSRCGSTLISQLLASLPRAVVISEAPPLDSVLRAHHRSSRISEEQRIDWFRWMVSALGQRIRGKEDYFFIKFDAWNVTELPIIRRAFPDVPWIFNYRDPVEVLVSQMNHRGAHMIPGLINPTLFGMSFEEIVTVEPEEYGARVLRAICEAGLHHHRLGSGLLINYNQLPEETWGSISRIFHLYCGDAEIELMKNAATRDAKNPAMAFKRDSTRKQQANERVREAARKWVLPIYEELERARKGQLAQG